MEELRIYKIPAENRVSSNSMWNASALIFYCSDHGWWSHTVGSNKIYEMPLDDIITFAKGLSPYAWSKADLLNPACLIIEKSGFTALSVFMIYPPLGDPEPFNRFENLE